MPTTVLVVPCYNEEERLDTAEMLRLVRSRPDLELLFVDDGSRDGTAALIGTMAAVEQRVALHRLPANRGKAEAVRQGLRKALARGATVVGYADADLSTPVDELLRMIDELDRQSAGILLGARVRLLGTRIERKPHRHYFGRVFATIASIALRVQVYDTQCGAKLFRASPAVAAAVAEPFRSRWIFDVELLARLRRGCGGEAPVETDSIRELPLAAWRDVGGSKLKLGSMLRAGLQLVALLIVERLRGIPGRGPRLPTAEPSALVQGAARACSPFLPEDQPLIQLTPTELPPAVESAASGRTPR